MSMNRDVQEPQWIGIDNISMAPLRPITIMDGHQVFRVGNDWMFSNDSLVTPLQPYPGATLPNLSNRTQFPIPDQVGKYCTHDEFLQAPKYMAQWVHWTTRAEMILKGHYHELPAAHFEGIFTLVCNFKCPHCTRRVTRTEWVEGGTWDNNTVVDTRNTMHPEGLKRVIDQMATMRVDDQMGIIWGGGDPTANPFTYDALMYARSLGITASFLTNGVFLEVDRVLDADPILVRVSLNCGTEEAYRKFHGYPRGWDYFERAKRNIRELARQKVQRKVRTLIGISLIVDERNLEDVIAAAQEIANVVKEVGPGIDYVIVRPVMNYSHFTQTWAKLEKDTKKKAQVLMNEGRQVWNILNEVNVPLVQIKDSFEGPPPETFYKDTRCLAYGLCGEVRHNGDVQLCSDSYGNPEYTIGNLFEQTLDEIWKSDRRQAVLDRINAKECYKTACPFNSRGHHYNRIFHQIEEMRQRGEMDIVRQWVKDLQEVTLPLGHSFFI